jgi:hypothetical protein
MLQKKKKKGFQKQGKPMSAPNEKAACVFAAHSGSLNPA